MSDIGENASTSKYLRLLGMEENIKKSVWRFLVYVMLVVT